MHFTNIIVILKFYIHLWVYLLYKSNKMHFFQYRSLSFAPFLTPNPSSLFNVKSISKRCQFRRIYSIDGSLEG